ncbi:nitroreductase [Advenella sp. S44]|uniref:nitroreductase n=1 Tax=Advenella sp. S44 TaxID=1982755 RepID=UPI000C2AFEB2|nr:nitroreductase [Advenella sp. S44]PJX25240.1 nitroreductase [Advenella sp. S44]
MNSRDPLFENETLQAILTRKSVRGFLPDPISKEAIRTILHAAARAPSGSNIQPWKIHVVSGAARDALSQDLLHAHDSGVPEQREYQYYPVKWREPYLARRRETGWSLYNTLGITREDKAGMKRQHGRNFVFFDAPVVLFITLDNDLETGSWMDTGMFIQNILIAARSLGLHTCPQAALSNYPQIIRSHLHIPDDQIIACGISLGYEDTGHPANQFRTSRIEVDEFAVFHADAQENSSS